MLRASGAPSILRELSDERIAVSMEDAARINAAAVAVQVFIGGEFETQSVRNMTRLVDESQRYGIPVLAPARNLRRSSRRRESGSARVTSSSSVLSDDASYVTCATLLADGGFIVNAEL